jgi:hypothetical protein
MAQMQCSAGIAEQAEMKQGPLSVMTRRRWMLWRAK